jgi:hypothetical protein
MGPEASFPNRSVSNQWVFQATAVVTSARVAIKGLGHQRCGARAVLVLWAAWFHQRVAG